MKTDEAIIGAGPGGTASDLFLEQAGINSTIIEKVRFPRYHLDPIVTSRASIRPPLNEGSMAQSAHHTCLNW